MRCSCGALIERPDDPTATVVTCVECGAEVDIIATGGDATQFAGPRDEPRDPLLGRKLGHGRYQIDSVIGEGGMGRVYLGTQFSLTRRVAIKVLSDELTDDEQFMRRFRREAKALAALEHRHIVSVYDLDDEDGVQYIVMAYVPGPTGAPTSLRELLAEGPLDEETTLRLIRQVCSALHFAHGRNVVHRDIKPANILIDEKGDAQIADFGIARMGLSGSETLTMPGTIMGSLKYMSPEQKVDSAHVDARSDLYSLGIVFYELLTGQVPEGRFDLPSTVRSELDGRVDTIVERILQPTPDRRYQSAEDLERDISSITTEREFSKLQTQAPAPVPAPTPRKGRAKPPTPETPKPKRPSTAGPPHASRRPARERPAGAAPGRSKRMLAVAGLGLAAVVLLVLFTRGDGNDVSTGGTTASREAREPSAPVTEKPPGATPEEPVEDPPAPAKKTDSQERPIEMETIHPHAGETVEKEKPPPKKPADNERDPGFEEPSTPNAAPATPTGVATPKDAIRALLSAFRRNDGRCKFLPDQTHIAELKRAGGTTAEWASSRLAKAPGKFDQAFRSNAKALSGLLDWSHVEPTIEERVETDARVDAARWDGVSFRAVGDGIELRVILRDWAKTSGGFVLGGDLEVEVVAAHTPLAVARVVFRSLQRGENLAVDVLMPTLAEVQRLLDDGQVDDKVIRQLRDQLTGTLGGVRRACARDFDWRRARLLGLWEQPRAQRTPGEDYSLYPSISLDVEDAEGIGYQIEVLLCPVLDRIVALGGFRYPSAGR